MDSTNEVTTVTPGIKTTEFWTTHLAQLVGAAAVIAGLFGKNVSPEQQRMLVETGSVVIVAAGSIYTLVRGWVKTNPPDQSK